VDSSVVLYPKEKNQSALPPNALSGDYAATRIDNDELQAAISAAKTGSRTSDRFTSRARD